MNNEKNSVIFLLKTAIWDVKPCSQADSIDILEAAAASIFGH
jgi:hypothetical protein